jgi:hypothetical protein
VLRENWIIEIVGVARDAKYGTLGEEPQSFMYFPLLQHYTPAATLHVRTEGDPAQAIGIVRSQVQALDKSMPLTDVNTIGKVMEAVLWAPRMGASLLAIFGLLALLLAAIGIHGVMSYAVAENLGDRNPHGLWELGSADVIKLILGPCRVDSVSRTSSAFAGAFCTPPGRFSSLLYGIGSSDPSLSQARPLS